MNQNDGARTIANRGMGYRANDRADDDIYAHTKDDK
jgi:hypothetical protein